MTLTDQVDVYTNAVWSLLNVNKSPLGLQDVWMGDQERLPRTPCVSVEPGMKLRELNGVPRRYQVQLEAYVMIYMDRIQDTQNNERQVLVLAEAVEAVLHADETLGGLVIDSAVVESNPGYVNRGGTLMSAVRLTFRAMSMKMLPYPPPS
jgi:hypothetical protein